MPAKHPHHALLDELIRLILLKVAEDIEPGELDSIMSLDTMDPQLVQKLKAHGDARHAKLSNRQPQPQGNPYDVKNFGDSRTSLRDKTNRAANAFLRDRQKQGR